MAEAKVTPVAAGAAARSGPVTRRPGWRTCGIAAAVSFVALTTPWFTTEAHGLTFYSSAEHFGYEYAPGGVWLAAVLYLGVAAWFLVPWARVAPTLGVPAEVPAWVPLLLVGYGLLVIIGAESEEQSWLQLASSGATTSGGTIWPLASWLALLVGAIRYWRSRPRPTPPAARPG